MADAFYTATERLYLTDDDPPQVVKEGDPRARRLLVGAGSQLPHAQAVQYGLVGGALPVPVPDNAPPPDDTAPQADAAEDDDAILWDAPAEDSPPNDADSKALSGPPRTKAQRGPQGTK